METIKTVVRETALHTETEVREVWWRKEISICTKRERTSLSRRKSKEYHRKSTGDLLSDKDKSVDLRKLLATTEGAQKESDE